MDDVIGASRVCNTDFGDGVSFRLVNVGDVPVDFLPGGSGIDMENFFMFGGGRFADTKGDYVARFGRVNPGGNQIESGKVGGLSRSYIRS